LFVLALTLGLPLLVAGRAEAQVSPLWDHYKVYETPIFPVPPLGIPIVLSDQFGVFQHQALQLERVMNPAMKEDQNGIFPINNPNLHYTWWSITPQPFGALVAATNQFGDQTLNVSNAVYLLNPALKNQTGVPPEANHYKCYLCSGQPVNKPVLLTDQFDQWSTVVMLPRYFCNPAQKQDPVRTYPILDPNQHYICYEIQPADPTIFPATVTDQFVVNHPSPMGPARWICVPTFKQGFTATITDTWGKLKQIYR
jgi:hypothetical protein